MAGSMYFGGGIVECLTAERWSESNDKLANNWFTYEHTRCFRPASARPVARICTRKFRPCIPSWCCAPRIARWRSSSHSPWPLKRTTISRIKLNAAFCFLSVGIWNEKRITYIKGLLNAQIRKLAYLVKIIHRSVKYVLISNTII